jgi:hypothetical protein
MMVLNSPQRDFLNRFYTKMVESRSHREHQPGTGILTNRPQQEETRDESPIANPRDSFVRRVGLLQGPSGL